MLQYITRVENRIIYAINGTNKEAHLNDGKLMLGSVKIQVKTLEIELGYNSSVHLAEIVLAVEVTKFLKEQKIV